MKHFHAYKIEKEAKYGHEERDLKVGRSSKLLVHGWGVASQVMWCRQWNCGSKFNFSMRPFLSYIGANPTAPWRHYSNSLFLPFPRLFLLDMMQYSRCTQYRTPSWEGSSAVFSSSSKEADTTYHILVVLHWLLHLFSNLLPQSAHTLKCCPNPPLPLFDHFPEPSFEWVAVGYQVHASSDCLLQ